MTNFNEPYPNIGFLLNRLANFADTKSLAMKGDSRFRKEEDFASRKTYEPDYINQSIDMLFYRPLEKVISPDFAEFFCSCISMTLNNYIELMKRVPMEAVEQGKVVDLLIKNLFVEALASIVWKVGTHCMGNDVPSFFVEKNPIQALIKFYESQNIISNKSIKLEFNDNIRTVNKWLSGEEIPSLGQLSLLANWASLSCPKAIKDDKENLFLARFIASFHKETSYKYLEELRKAVMWRLKYGQEPTIDLGRIFFEFYANELKANHLYSLSEEGNELHQLLKRTSTKPVGSFNHYKQRLRDLDNSVKKFHLQEELRYHTEWLNGRLLILSGDLNGALDMYLQAVESSLYKSGSNIRDILKDAMSIAAIQTKPHKPTLKKLKSRALTFYPKMIEYEHRDMPVRISDEEIDYWRFQFTMRFPQSGWFQEGKDTLLNHLADIGLIQLVSKVH